MEVKYFDINNIPQIEDEISLCLGYFDGLHKAHLQLIHQAKKSLYKSALLTFDFDESINLKNKSYITSNKDKEEILTSLGVDYLFVLKFDKDIMSLTPIEFVNKILLPLNVKEVVVGEDYTFGKNKSGNTDLLIELSEEKYNVFVIEELLVDNQKVGTSSIINMINNGEIKKANELLTRLYKISGTVNKGYGYGKSKSVPTANININGYVKPKTGVYATLVKVDNKIYKSMTNVGKHPSINELKEEIVETHIFDFEGDLYSKDIDVYFVDYLREEVNFNHVDDLYNQLTIDKNSCLDILDSYINSFSQIIPFIGVKEYLFNTNLDDFKNENYIDDVDVDLIGPSFEIDEHLYQVKHDDMLFSFEKNSKLLVEIDLLSDKHGSLKNGIHVGISEDLLYDLDPNLVNTDIEGILISNEGYVLIIEEQKVSMILLFVKELFNDLCFSYKEREERDEELLTYLKNKTKEYLKDKSENNEESLSALYSLNLDVTFKLIISLKKDDIINLGVVLSRLINENNYFQDYASEESLILRDIVLFVNKLVG